MHPPVHPTLHRAASVQRGVTLIELMVGMLIGLLVTVVITQVLALAEGQKRSTTSGSDAQVNGALALYTIQRDVQMAGYGLTVSQTALGCPIRALYNGSNLTWNLVPVTITDGGAGGAPDTIEILTSSKNGFSVPTRVSQDHPRTAANFFVDTTLGIAEGDLMVAVPATVDASNWCSVINVTGLGGAGQGQGQGQGQNQVLHNSGASGPWNQAGGQTIFPPDGYPAGSHLINLGQLIDKTYAINNSNALQVTVFNSTLPTAPSTNELYPQVVNLQAMYGKDTNSDGAVDTYNNTTPATPAEWQQIRTVRVVVVARSGQYEKDEVTVNQPLWDVGAAGTIGATTVTCGSSRCIEVKVDQDPDWRHYRYKVYDTVVPLRNVMWHM